MAASVTFPEPGCAGCLPVSIKPISSPAPAGHPQTHTVHTHTKAATPSAGSPNLKSRGTAPAGSFEGAQRWRNLGTKVLHAGRAQPAEALPPDAIVASSREILDRVLSVDRRVPILPQFTNTSATAPADTGLQLRKAQQAANLLQVAYSEAQRLEERLTHMLDDAGQLAEATGYEAQLKEAAGAIKNAMTAAVTPGPDGKAPIRKKTIDQLTELNASFDELAREVPVPVERKNALRQALQVAGRVRGNLKTLAEKAADGVKDAQKQAVEQHGKDVNTLAAHPPGFTAGPQQAALSDLLLTQTEGLPGPTGTGALTRLDVLKLAVPALSMTTGDDALRAQAALNSLATRSVQDWVPLQGAVTPPTDRAADDVRTLMRLMNHLPRGLEALSLMAKHDGQPPSEDKLDIIGTYWTANEAHQQAKPGEQSRPARAMAVAQYKLHPDSAAKPAPADLAAYAAVRSGVHTNERYEQVKQHLEQAFSSWIKRGAETPHLLPPLHIRHNLTPFEGKTLDLGARAAAETGLFTGATEATEKVGDVAGQLLAQVPANHGERELTLRAVLSHLQERETADVAGQPLKASDINEIAKILIDSAREAAHGGPPNSPLARLAEGLADLHDKATKLAQDGLDKAGTGAHVQAHGQLLNDLAKPGDMPGQVLERVLDDMASSGTKGLDPIKETLKQARRAEQSAGVHQIHSGEDLGRLLAPIMDHLKRGDALALKGGANTGVSLPYAPLGAVGPVKLTLSGAYHHERDASLEIKRDSTGILISVGRADLREGEAQITAGGQIAVADPAGAALTVGVRKAHSKQDTEELILRVPDRGDEPALLHAGRGMLHTLLTWGQQASEQAPRAAQKDLLSTLLERHEDTDVIAMSHKTRKLDTTEFSLKAGVMFDIPVPLQIGSYNVGSYKAGPQANLTYTRDHETAQRTDTGGHDRVDTQQSTATAQRLTLHAGVSLPLLTELHTMDLYQAAQRDTMTATTIGGRMDVEFERQALSPTQLLAEVGAQREAWLARAMAHNKSAPAGQNGKADQELAVQQLDSFIRDVKKLAEDKPDNGMFHHFVINQTLTDPARTAVEVLEARGRLATLRNDEAELATITQERKSILDESSSRQPGALLVTSHSDESQSKGLGAVAIAQRKFEAEAQHVAAQFPPA